MSNSVAVTVKHYAKCNGVFAAELFQEKNGAWRDVVDFTDGSPAVTLTHPMRLGIENSLNKLANQRAANLSGVDTMNRFQKDQAIRVRYSQTTVEDKQPFKGLSVKQAKANYLAEKTARNAPPVQTVTKSPYSPYEQAAIDQAIVGAFFIEHQHDYVNCPENTARMSDFPQREGLALTPTNLYYAFRMLSEVHSCLITPQSGKRGAPVVRPYDYAEIKQSILEAEAQEQAEKEEKANRGKPVYETHDQVRRRFSHLTDEQSRALANQDRAEQGLPPIGVKTTFTRSWEGNKLPPSEVEKDYEALMKSNELARKEREKARWYPKPSQT